MRSNKVYADFEKIYEHINTVYVPHLENKSRYLICYGGAGSGKSHFIAQKLLFRIVLGMMTGKRHKFLALRKTQPAVRRSVFALLKLYIVKWNLQGLCEINKQEMTIAFTNGSEILCMGLDDPEKIKSIEGVTGIWIEEATEFTLEDFTQLDLRLRGQSDSYKQIILSFNPISINSWIKAHFFDKQQVNSVILHTTYKDNRFLDAEYIRVLEGLDDPMLHKIYALGEWGELKGLIYTNWEVIDEWPDFVKQERIGIDFGFNNPSAIVRCGVYQEVYLFVDELLYESHLTNTQLIEQAKQAGITENDELLCDSAEPDRIEEFCYAGLNAIPCRKGPNSVKDGIDKVKSFKKIYITRRSTNVIKELTTYKWKEDKDGRTLDKPVEFNDHSLSAIRYAVGNMDLDNVRVTLL